MTRAPLRCATAAIRATGHSSPVTLLAPVSATSAGPVPSRRRAASTAVTAAAGVAGSGSRTTSVHGNRLAWCSPANVMTVVPAGRAWASRFVASVVLRVNTTVYSGPQPRKSATTWRARSYARVQRWDSAPAPRCTLA